MIRRSKQTDVEVQITPMLDMAFQLLTFFILTYRPSPVEGQFAMNLLPAQPVAAVDAAPTDAKADVSDVAVALRTLTTTLRADDAGDLGTITIGDNELAGLDDLKAYLEGLKKDETEFDQVLLQVDPHLRYQPLITVMDTFSQYYTKISFAELDGGGAPSL